MITRNFGTVTGGRLNLRQLADTSSNILTSIPNGTLLVVTQHDNAWYAVTYGAYTGFVMQQYITLLDLTNATEVIGEVTGGTLNLRRSASTSADRLAQIPSGTSIPVIDFDNASEWYIASYNGYTGYVMKDFVSVSHAVAAWAYGQVNVNELNVRKQPSTSATLWHDVWPLNRIVLIKDADAGWYESLYRGQTAYVSSNFITVLDTPVHANIVDRMLFMAIPELGRNDPAYFNGYSGEWCHIFADWLAMNAGMPSDRIPNNANCGAGMVWFINAENSGGFHFKNAEHKARFISNYSAVNHLDPSLTAAEEAYVPAPGDYIYFRWTNAANTVNVSHVGIVAAVGVDSLTTWEGNSGDQVVSRNFSLSDPQIVGYGKPDYTAAQSLES